MQPPQADLDEIRRAAALIAAPGSIVELSAIDPGREEASYGYYDDREALARDAARCSGHCPLVCINLNPLDPGRLSGRLNRLHDTRRFELFEDAVLRRRWLPIDCDPYRRPRTNSTETEHALARSRALQVRTWLRGLGWPDPVLADSGNGAHLLYRVDLPNDGAGARYVERALMALDLRFSDRDVGVDGSVADAARRWKLYGTVAAKGAHSPVRPHRLARILALPPRLEPVSPELLAALPRTRYQPAGR